MTDENWIYAHMFQPSVAEVEHFEERVAIQVANGMSEITARVEALKALVEMRAYARR